MMRIPEDKFCSICMEETCFKCRRNDDCPCPSHKGYQDPKTGKTLRPDLLEQGRRILDQRRKPQKTIPRLKENKSRFIVNISDPNIVIGAKMPYGGAKVPAGWKIQDETKPKKPRTRKQTFCLMESCNIETTNMSKSQIQDHMMTHLIKPEEKKE